MADLSDLNYVSISEMSQDEAIGLIQQIRLSRRVPLKKAKKVLAKAKSKKSIPNVSANQAAKLLKILGGAEQ